MVTHTAMAYAASGARARADAAVSENITEEQLRDYALAFATYDRGVPIAQRTTYER